MGDLLRRVAGWNLAVLSAFAFCALTAYSVSSANSDLAQGLHLEPRQRVLIIHADDAGVTHSVNQAIETAFSSGSISSASIIVPAAWFPEIAAFARSHPQYDFGVHLALTSEWRYLRWAGVSASDRIPSLLDREGFLWASAEDAAKNDSADQVRAELRGQIERARQFGVPVTHLDTHMDTLMETPALLQVYVDLGREYHLPIVLWREPEPDRNPQWLRTVLQASRYSLVYPIALDAKFPGPAGDLHKFPERYQHIIENIKPGQVTEIVVHLGVDNAELRAAMGDGSYGASWRATDFQIFTSREMHRFLRQQHVRLVAWKEIADYF